MVLARVLCFNDFSFQILKAFLSRLCKMVKKNAQFDIDYLKTWCIPKSASSCTEKSTVWSVWKHTVLCFSFFERYLLNVPIYKLVFPNLCLYRELVRSSMWISLECRLANDSVPDYSYIYERRLFGQSFFSRMTPFSWRAPFSKCSLLRRSGASQTTL